MNCIGGPPVSLPESRTEFVALTRLLPHESLNAAQVEDHVDLYRGTLGQCGARQNTGAKCACSGGEDLPAIDCLCVRSR